jgi:hypothetical protein
MARSFAGNGIAKCRLFNLHLRALIAVDASQMKLLQN